ncbi:MAG: DUF4965 domain-containing protein [Clostridia bacterium]|nr:DUF4965 domain-containing protein [Clostridia bacterium]
MKLRAPAVPLITVDPYFNIWSCADRLTDEAPRHWTGRRHPMTGLLKIDGSWRRFMGCASADNLHYFREADALEQTDLVVTPLTTKYTFEAPEVILNVTFFTPLLMDDLKLMSRPVSYISYEIRSNDGADHQVEFYFDISSEVAVNDPSQSVKFFKTEFGCACGMGEDLLLNRHGDDLRIEWGYLHLLATDHTPSVENFASKKAMLRPWVKAPVPFDRYDQLIRVSDGWHSLALTKEYTVSASAPVKNFFCVAYDDLYSIQYFGKNIKGYWTKDGDTFEDICRKALADYESVYARCLAFDADLLAKAAPHGEKYCDIVSLVYRQVIAAHKLTWDGESHQFLSKECFSNGCIGTVDVTYPSIPLFLLYCPDLITGMLDPIFRYAASDMWPYRYAPHDVGTYPLANGQVYGMSEKYYARGKGPEGYQMPVEECGNMLLCVAALCYAKKDVSYAVKNYDILKQWVDYLLEKGLDPENQLCTDDFAGHLAHNANLSVKAIMGIASWGMMLGMMRKTEESESTIAHARTLAAQWKERSYDAKNDCYRLAFDQEGTWSIKYNLVWDKLFDLHIFDQDVYDAEIRTYLSHMNPYGLPLDSRSDYTKSDWQMWSTVLTDDKEYEAAIVNGMWNLLDNIRDRVPFTDWYFTSEPYMRGFLNRTVQGGLFINLLK